jgi:regulation of enolase protein 1 (concanavalin A-like superfamily)
MDYAITYDRRRHDRSSRRPPSTLPALLAIAALAGAGLTCTDDTPTAPPAAGERASVERKAQALVVAETYAHADVGGVSAPGSYGESNGLHTVTASGADIYGTADEGHFVYRLVNGDTTITARVASLQNTNAWAKAAVMVRASLAAGAANVATVVSPTATNKFRRQTRATTNGSSTTASSSGNSAIPGWIRLSRVGNTFTAFTSTNGTSWTPIPGTSSVTMTNPVYVGLAVTSHNDGVIAAATFDSVSITGRPPAPPAGTARMYLEAEDGVLGATAPVLSLGSDAGASNGRFWQVPAGNNSNAAPPAGGRASYPFTVTTAGAYKVWARINAPTTSDDSLWVRMDTGAWTQWNDLHNGGVWGWNDLHDSAAAGAVVQYTLTAGNHTLELAYREDGTKVDRLLVTNDLAANPNDAPERPAVTLVTPANGATGAPVDPGAVTAEVLLPNLGGVDEATLTGATVNLRKVSDSSLVAATLNTSGGGDVIVLQPTAPLAGNTQYRFTVTDGLKDLSGASFIPFTSSFTTGTGGGGGPTPFNFTKVSLGTTATGFDFTSITIGPDGKVYAATLTGEIIRWTPDATGLLTAKQTITSIRDNNGGDPRAIIGLTFDPAATAGNLILWVTHGHSALTSALDWSGKLTRLTGANLTTYQNVVVNFPRSFKDHMTNSIAFKPGEAGVLYINQGSMTAMGAPDNAWGLRAEHLLAGAVLRVDTNLITTPPLDIQTNDADPTASGYNPQAAGAPVTIFASGVRNAYDLVWHSNGQLYVPTNGSAANGNTPASPSPLPAACTRRVDDAMFGDYVSPAVPAVAPVTVAQHDFLFRVDPTRTATGGSYLPGYSGHPNPFRCEWVMNGGDPTAGANPAEVTQYPDGTQPDRNWTGYAYDFGEHLSPNGVIEWKSSGFFASEQGKLLVIRYSVGDDIRSLTIDPVSKNVTAEQAVTGATAFDDPLDLAADPATGRIYVTEHGGRKITLLRPL